MNFLPHDIGNHFCEYAGIHMFIVFFLTRVETAAILKLYDVIQLAWVLISQHN